MRIITLQPFRGRAVLLLLLGFNYAAHADVYKCYTPSKQVVYQPMPCSSDTANENKVAIEKLTPQQQEDLQKRLKATEAERQAEQARQAEAAARWQAEAPQREAAAAMREAEAARREAAEAKQQAATAVPYPVYIPYSNYGYNYGYGQQPNYNSNYGQSSSYNNPSHRYNIGLEPVNPNGVALEPIQTPNRQFNPMFSPQPMPYSPPQMMPLRR
jgi:Skp family chaperone for outer membrane proteins